MKSEGQRTRGDIAGVLIVERDYFIAHELRQAFQSLGCAVCGVTADVAAAEKMALALPSTLFAVLDLTLGAALIFGLADVLRRRGISVVFTAGGGENAAPRMFANAPIWRKPIDPQDLATRLLKGLPPGSPLPFANRLLQRMPSALIEAARPHLSRIQLPAGAKLLAGGDALLHFWFMESGVCGLSPVRESMLASAMIGVEGVVGACSLLARGDAAMDCRVIFAGSAIRIPARLMFQLLELHSDARELMLSYAHILHLQTASAAFSASALTIPQRVARWILMASDRMPPPLHATHELIAETLHVRRAGVTEALQMLASEGVIERRRGALIIRDRERLCDFAHEAYGFVEREYARLIES